MLRKQTRVTKDASLGERQIRIVVSDATADRVGDVMVPTGCDWTGFRGNPIVLAQHNPDHPVGTAQIKARNGRIEALIDFAPKGITAKADEYCALYKAGVMTAASVGFDPIESVPIDGGGRRYDKWTLLEISLVSVPANPSATVIERSAAARMIQSASTPAERERAFELNAKQRNELEFRQRKRAEGLAEPVDDELDAFLSAEYPGLDKWEASKARSQRCSGMTRHDRFLERARLSDFLKEHRRVAAMSPEQHTEYRRQLLEKFTPPVVPFRWDHCASAAVNLYNKRIFEMHGGRVW
jgi:HK97 family phage prohead protease